MDGRRFDDLVRGLVATRSRRGFVRGALTGLTGAALAIVGRGKADAAQVCRPPGATCLTGANCCTGVCDSRYRRCLCADGRGTCGGVCCDAFKTCINGVCSSGQQVNAAPTAVWQALTERGALTTWAMATDLPDDPKVGDAFRLRLEGQHEAMACEILELEPLKKAVFRWKNGPLSSPVDVSIALDEVDGGTFIRMWQSSGSNEPCNTAERMLGRAWQRRMLGRALPEYLRRQQSE